MSILSQLNSVPMYLICGGIIAFVAVVCVIFLVRAYCAGQALGMDTTKMKRTIISSATFSLLPSVGILLGVIALSGSLGTPWPWLRLSVIGALHYETQVAQAAAEQVGMDTLSAAEMTPQAFSTIALLMSICIIWGMTLSIFLNKKYTQKLTSNKKIRQAGLRRYGNDCHVHRTGQHLHRKIFRWFCIGERIVYVSRRLHSVSGNGGIGTGDGRFCIPH